VDNYFSQVKENKKFTIGYVEFEQPKPTITGLALFLGFRGKSDFKKYAENPEYTEVMDYAMLRLENRYEQLLQEGETTAKVGLKQFGGWEDMASTENHFTFASFMKDLHDKDETSANRLTDVNHDGNRINE
jgi:hypothetical protein